MTAISVVEPPSFVLMRRKTRGGRILNYLLSLLQQPERARACGSGPKSHTDRRPIDPPPVVELRIFSGETMIDPREDPNCKDVTFDYRANFFLFATLEQARPMAHGRVQNPAALAPPVLTGMPVSGMAYLDRPHEAGYFMFPDLSVRHEGLYRLTFSLYEETKEETDFTEGTPDEEVRRAVSTPFNPIPDNSAFDWRMEIKSSPFTVYSAKKFPGLGSSTILSRTVAEQGCRVRIRRDVRMRRRDQKPEQDRRKTSQTPERSRARSMSNASEHAPPAFQDPTRRPSVPEYPMPQAPPVPPVSPAYSAIQPPPGHLSFGGIVKRESMAMAMPTPLSQQQQQQQQQQQHSAHQPVPPPPTRPISPATPLGQSQLSPYQTSDQSHAFPPLSYPHPRAGSQPLCPSLPMTPAPMTPLTPMADARRMAGTMVPASPSVVDGALAKAPSSMSRYESRYASILPAPTPSKVTSIDSLVAPPKTPRLRTPRARTPRSRTPKVPTPQLPSFNQFSQSFVHGNKRSGGDISQHVDLCDSRDDTDGRIGRSPRAPVDSRAPPRVMAPRSSSRSSSCSISSIIEPSDQLEPVVEVLAGAGSKRVYSDTFETNDQRLTNGQRQQDPHHDPLARPRTVLVDHTGAPVCSMTYERASGFMLSRVMLWNNGDGGIDERL